MKYSATPPPKLPSAKAGTPVPPPAETAPTELERDRFRLAAEATNSVIWDCDLVRGAAHWSEGAINLLGDPTDLTPNTCDWELRIHPLDREAVVSCLRTAVASSRMTWEDHYRVRRPDGSYAHVWARARFVRNAAGEAVRMIGGLCDVSSRVENEKRLQMQARLVEETSDAIVVRSLDGQVRFWNRGAERLYGWTVSEAVGKNVLSLIHSDPAEYAEARACVLDSGSWEGEMGHLTKDHSRILVRSRWRLVRVERGHPAGIVSVETDVSGKRQIEAELLRARYLESIGATAGGIARDLTNLLTPLTVAAGVMGKMDTDPAVRELLSSVKTSAQHGGELIRQILSFVHGIDSYETETDPVFLVHDLERFARTTVSKDIAVTSRVDGGVWRAKAGTLKLHQALLKLCLHARESMPEGGSLLLAAENRVLDHTHPFLHRGARPGSYVVFTVADSGNPIPEALRDRIFEPLFSATNGSAGANEGLSSVRSTAAEYHGWVEISSDGNRGTTFSVFIPARVGTCVEPPADSGPAARGSDQLVLVVEDDQPIRAATGYVLESHGYRVRLAADGAQALLHLAREPEAYALVVTELSMPVMDGYTLVQAMQRMNANLPSIAVASQSDEQAAQRLRGLNIAALLPKPYTSDQLLGAVARIIASRPNRSCAARL
ncbi:hypothetical protein DB347_23835 [Opitutaceae bacterium EW11]|nr:hypothetical protein DB347_23835 [Opitutaceae bacterium EW11]